LAIMFLEFKLLRTFNGLFRILRLNNERTAFGSLSPRIARELRKGCKEVFPLAGVSNCVVVQVVFENYRSLSQNENASIRPLPPNRMSSSDELKRPEVIAQQRKGKGPSISQQEEFAHVFHNRDPIAFF
jgi:hypothetical protein